MKYIASRISALLLLSVILGLSFTRSAAQDNAIEQYIRKYKNIAEEEMQRTGVPAAISLAQGIIESQAGEGWLVEHSHNHFGIKCKANWNGPTIFYDDDHKNECFRVYATDDSSWRDHSDFLKYTPRYAFLFQFDPLDYKSWALGLKKAGYATNKAYAHQLIAYIEKYNLQQYSEAALARQEDNPVNTFAGMLERKIQNDHRGKAITENKAAPVVKRTENASNYPSGVFKINDRKVIFLPKGAQLIAAANKYHIRLARLLRFNELENDVLPRDQLIYLQKKRKTGVHEVHLVTASESVEQIAASEGMQLKWLYRFNHLSVEDPISPGEVLYLQDYKPETELAGEPRKAHNGFLYKLFHLFSTNKEKESFPPSVNQDTSPEMAASPEPVAVQRTAPTLPDSSNDTGQLVYQVQSGDTLYGISQKYGITVGQIKEWNDLRGDQIQIGQQLIIKK